MILFFFTWSLILDPRSSILNPRSSITDPAFPGNPKKNDKYSALFAAVTIYNPSQKSFHTFALQLYIWDLHLLELWEDKSEDN